MATEVIHNTPAQGEVEVLRNRISELEGILVGQQTLESLLGQREEFYRAVIESLAEGLLITAPNDRIIYANSRMEEITGYPTSELIGAVAYELLTDKSEWALMMKRNQERVAGKSDFYEHQMLRKDGTRHWVSIKATPYKNSKGEIIGTVGAVSCIQTQKSLELENEYLQDEIRSERCGVEMHNTARCQEIQQRFPGLIAAILNAHQIQSASRPRATRQRRDASRTRAG